MNKTQIVVVLGAILIVLGIFLALYHALGDQGEVKGTVMLSPTCPVETVPPEPNCAPKPYQGKIRIFEIPSGNLVENTDSAIDGTFSVRLAPGHYEFHPVGGSPYPTCASETVSVVREMVTQVELSCDTGIR